MAAARKKKQLYLGFNGAASVIEAEARRAALRRGRRSRFNGAASVIEAEGARA